MPNIPASKEGDVGPDDVAPVAATHSVSETTATHNTIPVRSSVAVAVEPESMATESAGPASVPTTTTQEGKPSSGGGSSTPGPASSLPVALPWDTPAV